jgi:hypothetical protein
VKNTPVRRRQLAGRALLVGLTVGILSVWCARDLLHTHRDLSSRHDCPACRVERSQGTTSAPTAGLVVLPTPVLLGILPDLHEARDVRQIAYLEPPPRSPPTLS